MDKSTESLEGHPVGKEELDLGIFPLLVTSSVPPETVETFLHQAKAGAKRACPSLPPLFTLVKDDEESSFVRQGSLPPLHLTQQSNQYFLDWNYYNLYKELKKKSKDRTTHVHPDMFAVLDNKSPDDATVVLCVYSGPNNMPSVRVPFKNAIDLHGLYAGALKIESLQSYYDQQEEDTKDALPRKAKPKAKTERSTHLRWKKMMMKEDRVVPKPGEICGRRFLTDRGEVTMLPGWSIRSKEKIRIGSAMEGEDGISRIVEELEHQDVLMRRKKKLNRRNKQKKSKN